MRRPQIAVVGSASASLEMLAQAESLGRGCVDAGWRIVCGGRGGVMRAVARGARQADRATGADVIGVLPSLDAADANSFLDIVLPTGLGHARNSVVAASGQVMVVVGGGAGTLSEVALAWTMDKPVVALSASGGWARTLAGSSLDDRRTDTVQEASTVEEALAKVACALVPGLTIRPERASDHASIGVLVTEAFSASSHGHRGEAAIVNRLRTGKALAASFVAEHAGRIVGHVALSPVGIDGQDASWLGLAPVSVAPALQGRGVGTALCLRAMAWARTRSRGCVVLGDLGFYGRFGFAPRTGLLLPGVPPEVFGATAWTSATGVVRYHGAFDGG